MVWLPTTHKEVVIVTTDTKMTGRASRDMTQLDTTPQVPDTVHELLQLTGPSRRRRDWLVIGTVVAALVAGIVLLITQPWADTVDEGYTGDWKDMVTGATVDDGYTGDWKDMVTGASVDEGYTGDWKDMVVR